MTQRRYPWNCPAPDCGYEGATSKARAAHVVGKHKLPGKTDDDVLASLGESGALSQDQGLDQAIATLTTEVREIKASLAGAAPKADPVQPVMDVIAHCEGGTCPSHTEQWEIAKSGIVEAAYANIPEDLVREKATALGMVHPSQILIKPVEVQA